MKDINTIAKLLAQRRHAYNFKRPDWTWETASEEYKDYWKRLVMDVLWIADD